MAERNGAALPAQVRAAVEAQLRESNNAELAPETFAFYCHTLQVARRAGIPFLVGGAYALDRYTGVARHTKDFDFFCDPRGEEAMTNGNRIVHEAVEEALKLESALARLRTPQRIALLHCSPIRETVVGEPEAIFPFLGSSRLEEPLNRYPVAAVFHGHAHRGTPEGRTSAGIPVYNVAMPMLWRSRPDRPPFRIIEVPLSRRTEAEGQMPSPALVGDRAPEVSGVG